MGIRFFCPSGHRLNVKSFLAGKRGVCPDCGMPVDIPMASDQRALSSKKNKLKVGGGEEIGAKATAVLEQSDDAERPEVDISAPAPPASPAHHDFVLPPSLDLPPKATTAPAPGVPTPNFAFESVRSAPVVTESTAPKAAPLAAATAPIGVAVAMPAVATPSAAPPPVNDAIAEGPMAIWYVLPAGGGQQYGPARGDVMRKWLAEGRVTNDSLVWREGWPDWRPASKVFSDFGPKPAAPLAEMAPLVPEVPRRAVRPARKTSTAQGVGIVIALGVVCVGLLVALLYVLMSGTGTPPSP